MRGTFVHPPFTRITPFSFCSLFLPYHQFIFTPIYFSSSSLFHQLSFIFLTGNIYSLHSLTFALNFVPPFLLTLIFHGNFPFSSPFCYTLSFSRIIFSDTLLFPLFACIMALSYLQSFALNLFLSLLLIFLSYHHLLSL